MIYKIKFEAAPREILFEILQESPVAVHDVLRIIKFNFKNSTLSLLDGKRKMKPNELVVFGKNYVITLRREKRQ